MFILSAILHAAPLLLVFLVGGALAVMRMAHHPTAAKLSLAGLLILGLTLIASRTATLLITNAIAQSFLIEHISLIMGAVGIATSLGNTLGVGILIAAAWVGRVEAM